MHDNFTPTHNKKTQYHRYNFEMLHKKRVSDKKVQSKLNEKTILMDCYFYKLELISLNNPSAKNHVIFEQPEQNEIIPSIVTWFKLYKFT